MLNPQIGETINVSFEGEILPCYIQAIGRFDGDGIEYLEVITNPGQGDDEFYAELYIEDHGTSWTVV
jgi:hypothetical protein